MGLSCTVAPALLRQCLLAEPVETSRKVSTLEWTRTPVMRLSGIGMEQMLERASYALVGAGRRGGGLHRGGAGEEP
ncbi:hypothetical protein [Nonomuraea jabiensis]|uniref:hypothetical protein n=1 Tax=Nonomuraea jabiensis TaxID=882448 RepID=UPI003D74CD27